MDEAKHTKLGSKIDRIISTNVYATDYVSGCVRDHARPRWCWEKSSNTSEREQDRDIRLVTPQHKQRYLCCNHMWLH